MGDDIAGGGGLDGSGLDAESGGVGGHLIEEFVLPAAAHDVERGRHLGHELGEAADHAAVFEGEALKDGANQLGIVGWSGLAGFFDPIENRLRHVAGLLELGCVGVDKRRGLGLSGHLDHCAIVDIFALFGPDAAAFLEEPHAGDVREKAGAAFETLLVREAGLARGGAVDRAAEFNAEERPGAGAEEERVSARGRSGHGGGGVVAAAGADIHAVQTGLSRDRGTDLAQHAAGLGDGGEEQGGDVEFGGDLDIPLG